MAAAAVATESRETNRPNISSAAHMPNTGSSQAKRAPVTSLVQFKDRATQLIGIFDSRNVNSSVKDRSPAVSLKRRMEMASKMHELMGEYSRDARQMLLDGIQLDFDLPLHLVNQMEELMARVARESSERMAPRLKEVAARAAKTLEEIKNKTPEERRTIAEEILYEIRLVHVELKRLIAEFGAFFQPLATVPAGFFAVPKLNVQARLLAAVAGQWSVVCEEIKRSVFAAVDVERSLYHTVEVVKDPKCIELRAAIGDAITFWVRIQKDGEALLGTKFIPDYLKTAEASLARIGSKLTVRQLLDVVVTRIENEMGRFVHLFPGRDPTPVRRVVQVGLVKLQVDRIQKDSEVGLHAALVYPTRQDLFPRLVLMLDFDDLCINAICEAITSNVSAALGFMVDREAKLQAAAAATAPSPRTAAASASVPTEEEKGSDTIAVIAEVYESFRSLIALCSSTATEQHMLRFFVALRAGINAGLPHAGMESVLAGHFHRLLKDSGSGLTAADVQFRAYDVRSACASFGPLLKDVDVFVRVYQHRLGSRLMSRKAPNVKLERFAVDELTASIGTAHTHAMRAMVEQYATSSAAAANHARKPGTAASPPGGRLVAVSRYAWPAFSMVSSATVTLHPAIAEITKKDLESFRANPDNAKTTSAVHPLLSNVELKTGSGAGIFGNAVQCSILLHLGASAAGLRANEVADLMKVTEREAAWMLGTLVRSGVAVQDTATGKFVVTKLPGEKRVVLSSVWGVASRKAAQAAGAKSAKDSGASGDDKEDSSCSVQ